MTSSDSNEDSTESLNEGQDEEPSKILKSIEDVYQTYRLQSSQEISVPNVSDCPESEEENQAKSSTTKLEDKTSETDSDSDYSTFLKHMNVRYSSYRIESGEVKPANNQAMDYRDYSFSQYPVCGASCSCQPSGRNGQDFSTEVHRAQGQMNLPSYASQEMPENNSYYSCGQSLPLGTTISDETIVNEPRATTSAASQNQQCSTSSCHFCCPMRQPGQQQPAGACYSCDRGYPGQEQQHMQHMSMPPGMGIDPSSGYPFFYYPAPGSYPGTGMGSSMPAMQMDQTQRGGAGQHNMEMNSSGSVSGSPSASTMGSVQPSTTGGATNQYSNNFDMEAFRQKYEKSLQQCYATAQQGLQQSLANANAQQYFNNAAQGNQQYYANSSQGSPQMYPSSSQGTPQYYDNINQELQSSLAYQGMPQPFSSPLGAQQYYSSSALDAQPFLPPSMPMPASKFFGNNSSYIRDTLHTQTVYSSDYKSFANEGNHFNHFPNGMDIGLSPESCPGYRTAGSPVLAEMGGGGQVFGMGGACEMNMNSYPLSQMGYSSPYSYEMPSAPSGYHPGAGLANPGSPI